MEKKGKKTRPISVCPRQYLYFCVSEARFFSFYVARGGCTLNGLPDGQIRICELVYGALRY